MIKTIQGNGTILIPKELRQQLPSNKLDMKIVNDEDGVKLILTPVGNDKKSKIVYE